MFNSQGHIAMSSLRVEETSAYCTLNHRASASNYQLPNIKRPAQDWNRRPQRLEARTLTATPPSPLNKLGRDQYHVKHYVKYRFVNFCVKTVLYLVNVRVQVLKNYLFYMKYDSIAKFTYACIRQRKLNIHCIM